MTLVYVSVNFLIVLMTIFLWFIARAGIEHYTQLYQNEPDTKKLKFIINSIILIIVSLLILNCTLYINKSGYNINYEKEGVENGIRR